MTKREQTLRRLFRKWRARAHWALGDAADARMLVESLVEELDDAKTYAAAYGRRVAELEAENKKLREHVVN